MPVAQFPKFEKLDKSIMQPGGEDAASTIWHQLSDERDHYLDGIGDALIEIAELMKSEKRDSC